MKLLIDESKLASLYNDLGKNKPFLLELSQTYREQVDELVASDCAPQLLAELVHRIAGSTAMVGPSAVADRLRDLEYLLRSGVRHHDVFAEVKVEVAQVANLLDSWVEQLPEDQP